MARSDITINMRGLNELENKLKKTYGEKEAMKKMRPIINNGTKKVQRELKKDLEVFRDTGATIDENITTNARITRDGTLKASIKWDPKGKKGRFHLVHLNEWGYTRYGKRIKPRGFGVIEKSIRSSSKSYEKFVLKGVEQWLK